MLGRVRVESQDVVNLYLVGQNTNELKRRMEASEKLTKKFEQVIKQDELSSNFDILGTTWDDPFSDDAKDYRKMFILATEGVDYIPTEYAKTRPKNNVVLTKKVNFYVNDLAREKIGDAYKTQSLLYKKAMKSPQELAEHQISWIGKTPQDLLICTEYSFIERENKLKAELDAFGTRNAEETSAFKKHIADEYGDVVKRYIKINKGTFSKDQFIKLCNDLGYEVITETINGKIMYTILEK
jgi:hypothetical protein